MAHAVLTAINVPDLSPADDAFTQLPTRHALRWVGLSGQPANALERGIRGVRLSRYRAAAQAALAAGKDCFVISHLPLMTAAVAHLLRIRGRHVPHLGFAFNFTKLPSGWRHAYLRNALSRVDQLTVFSSYEKTLYAEHFGIDPSRFVPVIWTQGVPPVQTEPGIDLKTPYLCAIGGEGRDFTLLIETAKRLEPGITMVIIARPHSLAGLPIPDNVTVLTNIPLARTWRIAQDSLGVLVPLVERGTCCGQITLVSAKLLGLPLATTWAYATREYVYGRAAVLECEPGDVIAYANLANRMVAEGRALRAIAELGVDDEREIHAPRLWATYVDEFVKRVVKNEEYD